jgi:hypothetical protein
MIVGISFFVLLFSYKNIINEREAKTKGEAREELRPLKMPSPSPPAYRQAGIPLPPGTMSQLGEMVKKVMLNLFQHLIESNTCETLNQVQGDKKGGYDTATWGKGKREIIF